MDSTLFNGIRSIFILKHLFAFLNEKSLLGIIKYNKKLQNKLNIGINNYTEFYNKIEIEVGINIDNISKNIKFINISKKDEPYYHIYFNNNEKEIKKNYIAKEDNISQVKIIIDPKIKSLNSLFQTCSHINKISFIRFNRKDITDMSCMFDECSSLKEINFTKFLTNNVTNMNYMFNKCSSLKELNLNNFNTMNVREMNYMFYKCLSLTKLNLNCFNTTNVINMICMFAECSSLKELNLNSFITNKLTDTFLMFKGCSSLIELYWNNLNVNNLSNIRGMFAKCSDDFKSQIKQKFNILKKEAFVEYY